MNLKTFCIGMKIQYQELVPSLSAVNKYYEITNPMREDIIAVPDGCIDVQVVWKDGKIQTHICGSFSQGGLSNVGGYDKCFGIKFNPGIIPDFIQGRTGEIIGKRVLLSNFLDISELENSLKMEDSFANHIDVISKLFRIKVTDEHEIVLSILQLLQQHNGNIMISDVIDTLGYSHRYSDRVFKEYIGFSIKKYSSIIRQQMALSFVSSGQIESVYEQLGYYDQAHFIHDFKKFTTLTPRSIEKQKKLIV